LTNPFDRDKLEPTHTEEVEMTAKEVKAPGSISEWGERMTVFLSGSIDMGEAPKWRKRVIEALPDWVVAYNPRRDDWGDNWGNGLDDPRFVEQVEWELAAMGAADIIAVHFVPGMHSPITLLEFGLWAKSGKLIVSCPKGYFRRGNVSVTARFYGVPVYDSLDAMIERLIEETLKEKAWR
jgi:hypothetical protein